MSSDYPKVSIVTPIHNGLADTLGFLESLSAVSYPNYEVVIIDDGSTDESTRVITEQYPEVYLLPGDGTLWWAGATNLGAKLALSHQADYVLTINNDNVVSPDFLDSLVETAEANGRCIVKSVVYDFEDRNRVTSFGGEIRWWSGHIDQLLPYIDINQKVVESRMGNGNSTLIPENVFRDIGFFDDESFPQYHADTEFLLRAGKFGYRVLNDTGSLIYNKSKKSVGRTAVEEMSLYRLIKSRRSPYYLKANYKIYKEYCPYIPFHLFLSFRYARMFKEHLVRSLMRR